MARGWVPSPDFKNLLAYRGVDQSVAWEDYLPEFVTYWTAKGGQRRTGGEWENKFIEDILRKERHRKNAGEAPKPISADWRPDYNTVEALSAQGIPREFINQAADGFRLWWLSSGAASQAWGAKFFEYCSGKWRSRTPDALSDTFTQATSTAWAAGLVPEPEPDLLQLARMQS